MTDKKPSDETLPNSQRRRLLGGLAIAGAGAALGTCAAVAGASKASAMDGKARFATPNMLTPDFWAVNAMGPPYSPGFKAYPQDRVMADASNPATCPAPTHKHLGDMLSAKKCGLGVVRRRMAGRT